MSLAIIFSPFPSLRSSSETAGWPQLLNQAKYVLKSPNVFPTLLSRSKSFHGAEKFHPASDKDKQERLSQKGQLQTMEIFNVEGKRGNWSYEFPLTTGYSEFTTHGENYAVKPF